MAEAAATTFHGELNAGDFDAIWSGADDSFRRASTRENYDKFIGAVHRKLGLVVNTTTTGWAIKNFNFQTSVVLVKRSEFEHGSGVETFTYAVHGDSVKLVRYDINSTELVTL
jgi:hypothetical protein